MTVSIERLAAYDHHSLTSHLTSEERRGLEIRLRGVLFDSVEALSLSLKSETPFVGGFWESYPCEKWPLIALKAFQAEKCSADQFATISLLSAALKEFVCNNTTYVVGTDASNRWSRVIGSPAASIRFKIILPSSPKYEKYLSVVFRWTEYWRALLKKKIMKDLPLNADRCLFVIKMPSGPVEYWGPMIKAITIATNGEIFPFLEKDKDILGFARKRKLILPAFPLLRYLTEWLDPELPIKMIPRLGKMTEKEVAEDRGHFSHVVALGMEEIPLPEFADGRPTGPFTFALHDIYHTYTYASRFRLELLFATNRMIQVLYTFPDDPDLTRLRGALIDGEFMNGIEKKGYLVGHLFDNPVLKPLWDLKGGIYKRAILEDMSKYRSFWQIMTGMDLGLSEENRVISLGLASPNFGWPPIEECQALNLRGDGLLLLRMAKILEWSQTLIGRVMKGIYKMEALEDSKFKEIFPENTGQKALEIERERYLLCMELFTSLPKEKSVRDINYTLSMPLSTIALILPLRELILSGHLPIYTLNALKADDYILLTKIKEQITFPFPDYIEFFGMGLTKIGYFFNFPEGYRVIGLLSTERRASLEKELTATRGYPDSDSRILEVLQLAVANEQMSQHDIRL